MSLIDQMLDELDDTDELDETDREQLRQIVTSVTNCGTNSTGSIAMPTVYNQSADVAYVVNARRTQIIDAIAGGCPQRREALGLDRLSLEALEAVAGEMRLPVAAAVYNGRSDTGNLLPEFDHEAAMLEGASPGLRRRFGHDSAAD